MFQEQSPKAGTDAWFKEVENHLHELEARLADAAALAAQSTSTRQNIAGHLSIVQELLARIEDRVARLVPAVVGDGSSTSRAEVDEHDAHVVYLDVPGFVGYRVGSDGSVWGSRSAGRGYGRTRDWRQLKPYLVRPGPGLAVSLYRDRVRHITRLDALVLLTFVGPCPDGCAPAHANSDPFDNRRDNLRYAVSR